MVCNRTTKQHHQNRCSGFFRLFRCSGVFWCSGVPGFSTCRTKCLMRHILVSAISGLKLQIWHHAFPLIFTVQAQFSSSIFKCQTEPPSYDFKIWTCWIFFRQELTSIYLVAVIVPLPWLVRCLQVLHQEGIGNLLFTKLSPHLNFARYLQLYIATISWLQWAELHKTMFVAKIHRNLSNIHKVMTLSANLALVGSKVL